MASAYDFAVNIVMLINITIKKTHNIHDSVRKIIYATSTYNFAVNIVMVINITINIIFGIYDLFINYSYDWENNVLTFIQVSTDKNNQIKNIKQAHTDNNKFMQIKNRQGKFWFT